MTVKVSIRTARPTESEIWQLTKLGGREYSCVRRRGARAREPIYGIV